MRQEREGLRELQQQAATLLDELVAFERLRARDWRRSDVKLQHARKVVRRERVAQASRNAEALDEELTEQLAHTGRTR